MKKCAEDLLFFSIRNENEQQKQIADTFLQLYGCDWKTSISAKALNSLSQRKFNKTQLLPLVEDVVKMNSYLNKRAEEIKKNWTEESYAEFAKICLAQVILFNRKRSGEAERMTVKGVHDSKRGGHVDRSFQMSKYPPIFLLPLEFCRFSLSLDMASARCVCSHSVS